MMFQRPLRAALFAAACVLAPQAAIAQNADRFLIAEVQTPNPDGDVLDVAAATGQFTRFLAAVEAAGYEETLRGEGPFTIFAPTDDAFRQMDQAEIDRLMQPVNRDELLALLSYHVVAERVTTESVNGRTVRPESSNGYRVTVDGRDGLRVNDELVTMPDINARNGVIQGINSVLSPPVLVADASTSNSGR
jgi:uncharacterized surface protein with fasciclin (FAS1) repeats